MIAFQIFKKLAPKHPDTIRHFFFLSSWKTDLIAPLVLSEKIDYFLDKKKYGLTKLSSQALISFIKSTSSIGTFGTDLCGIKISASNPPVFWSANLSSFKFIKIKKIQKLTKTEPSASNGKICQQNCCKKYYQKIGQSHFELCQLPWKWKMKPNEIEQWQQKRHRWQTMKEGTAHSGANQPKLFPNSPIHVNKSKHFKIQKRQKKKDKTENFKKISKMPKMILAAIQKSNLKRFQNIKQQMFVQKIL